MTGRGGRINKRIEVASLVKLSAAVGAWEQTAVVEDVSATGCCVSVPDPVDTDERVRLRSVDWAIEGVVRHCTYREQDAHYAIGIDLAVD